MTKPTLSITPAAIRAGTKLDTTTPFLTTPNAVSVAFSNYMIPIYEARDDLLTSIIAPCSQDALTRYNDISQNIRATNSIPAVFKATFKAHIASMSAYYTLINPIVINGMLKIVTPNFSTATLLEIETFYSRVNSGFVATNDRGMLAAKLQAFSSSINSLNEVLAIVDVNWSNNSLSCTLGVENTEIVESLVLKMFQHYTAITESIVNTFNGCWLNNVEIATRVAYAPTATTGIVTQSIDYNTKYYPNPNQTNNSYTYEPFQYVNSINYTSYHNAVDRFVSISYITPSSYVSTYAGLYDSFATTRSSAISTLLSSTGGIRSSIKVNNEGYSVVTYYAITEQQVNSVPNIGGIFLKNSIFCNNGSIPKSIYSSPNQEMQGGQEIMTEAGAIMPVLASRITELTNVNVLPTQNIDLNGMYALSIGGQNILIASSNQVIYRYNTTTNALSIAGGADGLLSYLTVDQNCFGSNSMIMLSNGNVLITDSSNYSIVIYNPSTDTATYSTVANPTVFLNGGTTGSFIGGVLMNNGKVLMIPKDDPEFLIYDPILDTLTNIGVLNQAIDNPGDSLYSTETGNSFIGGCLMQNGKVFICPDSSSNAIIYNPVSGAAVTVAVPIIVGYRAFGSCFLLHDGRVFLAPHSSAFAQIYNPTTGLFLQSHRLYKKSPADIPPVFMFGQSCLLPNGCVFLPIFNGYGESFGTTKIYNPFSDSVSDATSFEASPNYAESFYFGGALTVGNMAILFPMMSGSFRPITFTPTGVTQALAVVNYDNGIAKYKRNIKNIMTYIYPSGVLLSANVSTVNGYFSEAIAEASSLISPLSTQATSLSGAITSGLGFSPTEIQAMTVSISLIEGGIVPNLTNAITAAQDYQSLHLSSTGSKIIMPTAINTAVEHFCDISGGQYDLERCGWVSEMQTVLDNLYLATTAAIYEQLIVSGIYPSVVSSKSVNIKATIPYNKVNSVYATQASTVLSSDTTMISQLCGNFSKSISGYSSLLGGIVTYNTAKSVTNTSSNAQVDTLNLTKSVSQFVGLGVSGNNIVASGALISGAGGDFWVGQSSFPSGTVFMDNSASRSAGADVTLITKKLYLDK